MSVDIGIIGLPQSGRTTVFNALTGGNADTGTFGRDSAAQNIGTAVVPEPRIAVLTEMYHPQKISPTSVRYVDIGASVKTIARDKGSGGQLLAQLGNSDALINVVRAFEDSSLPHPEGSLDINRDITNMNLELVFSDLTLLERRLERIKDSLKGAKPAERPILTHEQDIISRIKTELENDVPARELELSAEELKIISGYQLLSLKPLLIAVNIGEASLESAESMAAELNQKYGGRKCRATVICAELEMELSRLDDAARSEMSDSYGIEEAGGDRVIRLSFELLGLISFFTVGPDEVKAWPIQDGTEAVKAAGKIHTDIEKGFIRAEVVSYEDLIDCGSIAEARKRGVLRLEGKTYTVRDGDVINFLFNV